MFLLHKQLPRFTISWNRSNSCSSRTTIRSAFFDTKASLIKKAAPKTKSQPTAEATPALPITASTSKHDKSTTKSKKTSVVVRENAAEHEKKAAKKSVSPPPPPEPKVATASKAKKNKKDLPLDSTAPKASSPKKKTTPTTSKKQQKSKTIHKPELASAEDDRCRFAPVSNVDYYLGLDISTSCTGFTVLDKEANIVKVGYIDTMKLRSETGGDVNRICAIIRNALLDMKSELEQQQQQQHQRAWIVGIEDFAMRYEMMGSSAKVLFFLAAVNSIVSYDCFEHFGGSCSNSGEKRSPYRFHPNSVRAFFGINDLVKSRSRETKAAQGKNNNKKNNGGGGDAPEEESSASSNVTPAKMVVFELLKDFIGSAIPTATTTPTTATTRITQWPMLKPRSRALAAPNFDVADSCLIALYTWVEHNYRTMLAAVVPPPPPPQHDDDDDDDEMIPTTTTTTRRSSSTTIMMKSRTPDNEQHHQYHQHFVGFVERYLKSKPKQKRRFDSVVAQDELNKQEQQQQQQRKKQKKRAASASVKNKKNDHPEQQQQEQEQVVVAAKRNRVARGSPYAAHIANETVRERLAALYAKELKSQMYEYLQTRVLPTLPPGKK